MWMVCPIPQAARQEDKDYLQEKERINEMTRLILEGKQREVPADVISAVCQHLATSSQLPVPAESLAADASSVPDLFAGQGQTTLPGMTRESWHEAQSQDPSIKEVIKLVESAQKPSFKTLSTQQPEVKLLLREWSKLELRDGILYRRCHDRGDVIHQLVLPEQHRDRALQGLHDEVGHLGAEHVLSLARARFYWPRMKVHRKEMQAGRDCSAEEKGLVTSLSIHRRLNRIWWYFANVHI